MDSVETRGKQAAQYLSAIKKTKRRVITRRAVMWLGQTCNLRCYFCYFVNRISDFRHPEHPFMSVEKAKAICKTVREYYGCSSIDIQGGEPTIHPDILELITYCRDIGLYPTLITNGLRLAHPGELEKYVDAGVRDFLVSLHGIGAVHDQVVGRPDAYEDITTAIGRMRELGVPFRFNCTMSEPVVPLLPEIAQKAIEYGALGVNYIAFNPFGDQETGQRTSKNVPQYGQIQAPLTQALDMLEEAHIEVNVRYIPLCIVEPRHRKNVYNYQQLSYDLHEWNYASWLWTMMQPQMMQEGKLAPVFHAGATGSKYYRSLPTYWRDYAAAHPIAARLRFGLHNILGALDMAMRGKDAIFRDEARIRAAQDCKYRYHEACARCAVKSICDGFHGDYADLFGTEEARPMTDMQPVDDPCFFIREQEKIVEPEEQGWAL